MLKEQSIVSSAMELAKLMLEEPSAIESDIYQQGENLVGIFTDQNYTSRRFPNMNQKKIETLQFAIEDISRGVLALRTSSLGLSYAAGDIVPYMVQHGSLPSGTVIFSVMWKNLVAFKNWRHGEVAEVGQEDINAAIYMLTVEISKLLGPRPA